MEIKLKHSPKKCWACKRQNRINNLCKKEPFAIEFDFFKDSGDIIPLVTYTANYKKVKFPLLPLFEVTTITRNTPINLVPPISDNGIKYLIEQAKVKIQNINETKIYK